MRRAKIEQGGTTTMGHRRRNAIDWTSQAEALFGKKNPSVAEIEVMLLEPRPPEYFNHLYRNAMLSNAEIKEKMEAEYQAEEEQTLLDNQTIETQEAASALMSISKRPRG